MKNFIYRACLATITAMAVFIFMPLSAFAFGPDSLAVVGVDYSNPSSFVSPENVNALTVAVMVIAGFLSGLIPQLKNIKQGLLRTVISGFIVVAGAATFKFGFMTEDTLKFVLASFLPNFAYSGVTYEILKTVLKLLGINIKKEVPAAV